MNSWETQVILHRTQIPDDRHLDSAAAEMFSKTWSAGACAHIRNIYSYVYTEVAVLRMQECSQ